MTQATTKDHILVVDDNESDRKLMEGLLKGQGYKVTMTGNGREAVKLVRNENFCLVLLDIEMPQMDGLSVLREIRSEFTDLEVPVIMVTIKDDPESARQALDLGANDYVAKPFEPAVLFSRVSTWKLR